MHSVYIHIPFCDSICSYCDFAKLIKNDKWVLAYLNSLKEEIKTKYNGEIIETLYIGGGTPSSLNIDELKILFDILKIFNLSNTCEFTFECNIENINEEKLKFLYQNHVNRLSIGVQTFNEKFLKFLNRHHTKDEVLNKIKLAKGIGFKNINIDLIYALEGETLNDLKNDLDMFLKLDINHISTYSLIIEENTILSNKKVKNIDEDMDLKMYNLIQDTLKKHGFIHYEISNFSKTGYQSKHNLVYWNNLNYYGFGLGAAGYINNTRYENTRSITKYINKEYIMEEHDLDIKETISNELILGFRKIEGINKNDFYNKYHYRLENDEKIKKLLDDGMLIEDKNNIFINPKYIYISNEILINFI